MAPATIANGRVYLASFGKENTGTGQLCAYGLLPRDRKVEAPIGVYAQVLDRNVVLTWSPVVSARFYRVERWSVLEPAVKTVANGLTMAAYTEPAPERGESASYSVVAVGVGGVSAPSLAVAVSAPRQKPMHIGH